MDTASSFMGGGWGSGFGGYSSGLLNGPSGFGSRGPTAFGSTGFMETMGAGQDLDRQQREAALQKQLAGMQQQGETQRAVIAAKASTLPARLQQQRFQQVFPYLSNALGMFSNPNGMMATAGGSPVGTPPAITAAPVYSPQMIQQQVNATRAQNDAQTQNAIRGQQASLAGRGLGAGSPLAMALQGQALAANQATNTGAEQQLRFNTAAANAQQLLEGQKAQESAYEARQQEDLERRKPYFSTLNTLLGVLGSFR